MWRRFAEAALELFYPSACPLCLRRLEPDERTICGRCVGRMRLEPAAWRCAICGGRGRGAEPEGGKPCKLCPPAGAMWNGALAATGYHDPAPRCVHLFKYRRRVEAGEAMARIMRAELAGEIAPIAARIDVVMPAPIHWRRRLWRGFNQSDLLAKELADMLGRPFDPKALRRVKHTPQQARLPRERRAGNVKGAFAMRGASDVAGKGILIVDDIVTSGETIGECARVLREAGAREVWVACFARAGIGGPGLAGDDWA